MLIPFTPYEPVAKLQHNASPPSHPLLSGFPIKIARGTGLDMDTLSTMPHILLRKTVSEFACGFPMIQLKVFWPGYEVLSFMERITVKGQSEGEIINAIIAAFQRFIQRALKLPVPPRGAAQYAITANSPFAKKNRIILRAIHHVGDDVVTLELECKS